MKDQKEDMIKKFWSKPILAAEILGPKSKSIGNPKWDHSLIPRTYLNPTGFVVYPGKK